MLTAWTEAIICNRIGSGVQSNPIRRLFVIGKESLMRGYLCSQLAFTIRKLGELVAPKSAFMETALQKESSNPITNILDITSIGGSFGRPRSTKSFHVLRGCRPWPYSCSILIWFGIMNCCFAYPHHPSCCMDLFVTGSINRSVHSKGISFAR